MLQKCHQYRFWNWFLDYPKFHFQSQHLYTRSILRVWWKLVATVTGMLKIASKLGLLFSSPQAGTVISLEVIINVLEHSKTCITQIWVQLVDGFKGYLDRQFTSCSCALNVYTQSRVYLSVTNGKLTLCTIAKNLCFTKTKEEKKIQSTLDTSNFKGLGKICRVIRSSR